MVETGEDTTVSKRLRRTLEVGSATGFTLILAGVTLLLFGRTEGRFPLSLVDAIREASQLSPTALLGLGVLVLIFTPPARVLVALLSFSARKEKLSATFSALALSILIASFVIISNL